MNTIHKKISILSYEHPAESMVLRAIVLALALVSCLYLYFVAASVLNIIARKEADVRSTAVQSSINVLEQQYFALSQSTTQEEASNLGLVPIKSTSYVYQPGNAAAASIPASSVTI